MIFLKNGNSAKFSQMKKAIVVLLVLLFYSVSFSQEQNAFSKLRERFSKAENFSVDFNFVGKNIQGNALYSKKFGEKIIFGSYEILVKGDTVFNYNKKADRLVISPRDNEYENFSLKSILFDLPEDCKIENADSAIAIIPDNPDEKNFKRIEIFLKKNGLPGKIKIVDLSGNETFVKLGKFKFNSDLSEKDFVIHKKKTTKIIDFR